MLKALELAGFKSFADKTRFDFPPGITVIVGPNGSGKSNVVDAIKWVLGEQSVKSLRGKEMADVIFKGSPTGGRKMMNFAEASIVFDNTDRRLGLDVDEVRVTRRVYRSGEGEYLINDRPCRLRDIRDLFRGTGVGSDAYSLIEQGKVDRMLQASPKERRAIFEEAAGISRFKAKKLETQRRLERVSQNLVRLSDIVDEVESRLKTVRAQATKAQQYRAWQQRLQELRTHVGLSDWKALSRHLEGLLHDHSQRQADLEQAESSVEAMEARRQQIVDELAATQRRADASREEQSRLREAIAAERSTIDHRRHEIEELAQRRQRLARQLVRLRSQIGGLDQQRKTLEDEVHRETARHAQVVAHCRRCADEAERLRRALQEQRLAVDHWQGLHTERAALQSACSERAQSAWEQAESAHAAAAQHRAALEAIDRSCRDDVERLGEIRTRLAELEKGLGAVEEEIDIARQEEAEDQRIMERRRDELSALRSRLAGLRERADLLDQLQRRGEGIGAGAREVLGRAERASRGPLAHIRGILGELIDAPLDVAPLVDLVLGPLSAAIVLRPGADLHAWGRIRSSLPGRVHLLPLDAFAAAVRSVPDAFPTPGRPAPNLAQLVDVPDDLANLRDALLGNTYVVPDYKTAVLWHGHGFPFELVTRDGERVAPNGAVTLGPASTTESIVSRRSELRSLQRGLVAVQNQIDMARQEIERLEQRIDERRGERAAQELRAAELREQIADERVTLLTLEDRLARHRRQRGELQESLQRAVASAGTMLVEFHRAAGLADNARVQQRAVAAALEQARDRRQRLEREWQAADERRQTAQIERARHEEWLESLRAQFARFDQDCRQRSAAIDETQQAVDELEQRAAARERDVLEATASLAQQYLALEAETAQFAAWESRRGELQEERDACERDLQRQRRAARRIEQQLQELELKASQCRQERDALEQRFRDDYDVDLSRLAETFDDAPDDATDEAGEETGEAPVSREAIEAEIGDLRQKLATAGAVNLAALEELDELEERFQALSGQYGDLVEAKEALERIISKINADSRRLFSETLEAIRTNFRALYRKAFGGGNADLVLEPGVDILEAGIDIVATPPGKPSFNNSLLSGGEKALTAVSLLLAIFQHRPSPFCVLDEVDAPFDEANIGRFVDVLREFLDWTRFVVVTHSKKTMTAADTLYGVTMQESGVSKRVAVRFEDVHEGGRIGEAALRRAAQEEAADDGRAA